MYLSSLVIAVAASQLHAAPALTVSIRANTVVELRLDFPHDLVLCQLIRKLLGCLMHLIATFSGLSFLSDLGKVAK
jgi:hypothetical protein